MSRYSLATGPSPKIWFAVENAGHVGAARVGPSTPANTSLSPVLGRSTRVIERWSGTVTAGKTGAGAAGPDMPPTALSAALFTSACVTSPAVTTNMFFGTNSFLWKALQSATVSLPRSAAVASNAAYGCEGAAPNSPL